MDLQEALYYVGVWAIGTLSGCFRSGRDGNYNGLWHLLSIGGVAGFLAVGVVAIGGFYAGGRGDVGCGIAAVVGALGREVTDTLLIDIAGGLTAKIKAVFSGNKREDSDDQ